MRRFFFLFSCLVVCAFFITGCSGKKTTTNTVSDATNAQPDAPKNMLGSLDDDSLFPSGVVGTKTISFAGRNVSVEDNGMRQVFVDNGPLSGLTEQVFAWLTAPGDVTNKTELLLKQATVMNGGSSLLIPQGAVLASYVHGYNIAITASGDDLLLQADITKSPYDTYLLFAGDLPENYLVTNPNDRFGDAIYMIPQGEPSLLKFVRGSDLESVNISYLSGEAEHVLAYGYQDMRLGFYTLQDELFVPGNTPLRVSGNLVAPEAKAYHVVFDEKQKTISTKVDALGSPVAKNHLINYVTQRGWGVSVFEKLPRNASGDRQVTTTDATEQAIFVEEAGHSYLFPLHNYPFLVELQQDVSVEYNAPYYSRLLTTYLLDTDSVMDELEKVFGKSNITYNSWDKSFSYQIQPKQTYAGTLAIRNIFGQTAELKMNYRIENIDPRAVTQDIVANNTISILPRSGVFTDILLQYKNIGSFQVQFQGCDINSLADINAYKGVGIENYLFACSGPVVTQEVKPTEKDFVYRKAYRTPVQIPESLNTKTAFKVFFKDQLGQEKSHYMVKSDIGLWTKVAGDQLWIWGFLFDNGQPLGQGEVKVSDLEGKLIGTASLKDGFAKISLPQGTEQYDYQIQRKKESYLVEVKTPEDNAFVIANRAGRSEFSRPNGNDTYSSMKINSKLDISEVTSSSTQINQRGMLDPLKIYGYTDRGLYKAGDTVHFAGRVRDVLRFDNLDYLQDMQATITLSSPLGGDPVILENLSLDKFGGFVAEYKLPSTLTLGEYVVEYRLNDRVAYSHNIKIEEYQKPTFFVDMSYKTVDNMISLVMKPTYFFGAPVQQYDVRVTWSLVGKDICWYCRWRNEDDYYFNHVFNDSISKGGEFTLYNQTAEQLVHELYAVEEQVQKGYQYTLKVDAIVKDRLSQETQFITKHIDFAPEVMLGVSGQPYEWLYRDQKSLDPRSDRSLEGVLKEGKELVSALRYEIYRWSYDQQMQQGVDGSLYFINGQGYLPVSSGSLSVGGTFSLSGAWITNPGEYFIRIIAEDKAGKVVGETQKKVGWYLWSDESDLLGSVPNNYALTIDVPKKTYALGEDIPLNIAPYQRDAWVVVTVEKGQYIIDTYLKKLDGKQLTIPVKKGYAPNVIVNVMMLQGTQMNTSPRKEPRFFAGYAEVKVDTAMHELNIAVTADKTQYLPGEQVTLSIATTDDKGKPIDARVSVAVVDQALASMYTLLKEPLPYFFNTIGTSVFTYTNMKLLYQSLKAFATGGSKGGAGQGGKAMFSYIRDDLQDVAFRSGAVYTKDGRAEVSFTAPENLTTWLVDALGIGMETRLGTTNMNFIVKKNLIVESNPPLFVTIGDELKLPVKILVTDDASGGKTVDGSVWIQNQYGERIDLGNFSQPPNSTFFVKVAIPQSRWTSKYIELFVEGSLGTAKDGIKHIIPLRADGLMSVDSVGTINSAGSHTFTLPESHTQSLSVQLSQLPTNFIEPIAEYLVQYPYGCTEQILSSLLPLVAIEQLRKKGIITSSLLSGSTIITESGPVDMLVALRDGVATLLTHQRADGGFGYRASEQQNGEVTRANYLLSAYVYYAFTLLKTMEGVDLPLDGPVGRLENFLSNNRGIGGEGWYRYLFSKVTAGDTLTSEQQASLGQIQLNETGYLPLLRYLIAIAQQDLEAIKTRRLVANIPTNEDGRNDMSVFLNPITATSMKLRALIDDPEATQKERSDLLLSLLRQRDKNGLRGWSTQSNVQVLLTLSKLTEFRTPKKVISCSIEVDGTTYPVSVMTGSEGIDLPFSGTSTQIDWTCDSPLLADVRITFLPKDLEKLLGAADHVSNMSWSISNENASVGEKVDIVGSFSTDLAGEQVAVELFVPSDYKLLEVISQKKSPRMRDNSSPKPFLVSDPHCQPTHREARFDRLFLYYAILQPGVCDITIPALKAYAGITTIMPMRVSEMYRGLVNGRKVILR